MTEEVATIYVARHGRTAQNCSRLFQGPGDDPPLDLMGQQQAYRLTQAMRLLRPTVIVSSPAQRTVQTVQPVAAERFLEMRLEEDLRERINGTMAGQQYPLGDPYPSLWEAMQRGDGEALETVGARAVRVREKLLNGYWSPNVLVSTHGLFATVLGCVFNQEPLRYNPRYRLANGNFHEFTMTRGGDVLRVAYNLSPLEVLSR